MKFASIAILRAMAATWVVWLFIVPVVGAQEPSGQRPPMSEEIFKNVQILKGIPVDEFMGTMGFFAASLGLNCTDCHISESSGDWARYADDTTLKRTTRRMIQMVNTINAGNFGGRRAVRNGWPPSRASPERELIKATTPTSRRCRWTSSPKRRASARRSFISGS